MDKQALIIWKVSWCDSAIVYMGEWKLIEQILNDKNSSFEKSPGVIPLLFTWASETQPLKLRIVR